MESTGGVMKTWMPKIAETEDELMELCEDVKDHKRLPQKFRQVQPQGRWPPKNNSLNNAEAIRRMRYFLKDIQDYISSFEYNFTGTKYNQIRKDLGMKRIVSTAREITLMDDTTRGWAA